MTNLIIRNVATMTIVKFPMKKLMILPYLAGFLVVAALPLYFVFTQKTPYNLPLSIVLYPAIILFSIASFVLFLRRKVVIENEKKQITVFNFIKRGFFAHEIISMDTKVKTETDGPYKYYYLLIILNDKKIKLKTQSQEQSDELMKLLNKLKEN